MSLLISTNFYASPETSPEAKIDPLSEEISRVLSRSTLTIEEDLTVKVFLTVTKDKRIEIRSVASIHAGVKVFLEESLSGQQLQGENWNSNKIYELPVRVKAFC